MPGSQIVLNDAGARLRRVTLRQRPSANARLLEKERERLTAMYASREREPAPQDTSWRADEPLLRTDRLMTKNLSMMTSPCQGDRNRRWDGHLAACPTNKLDSCRLILEKPLNPRPIPLASTSHLEAMTTERH